MAPKLYCADLGPPSRSVLLTVKAIGLELELIDIDILIGEHRTSEFREINPQLTIPALVDNGICIGDSHAINIYLVRKYANNDFLYPKDPRVKSVVDQRLFFNASIIQSRTSAVTKPTLLGTQKEIPQDRVNGVLSLYNSLESFFKDHKFVAADSLTIADFSIVAPISSISYLVPISRTKYPRLWRWIQEMEKLPYYAEANQVGCDKLNKLFKLKLTNT